MNRCVVKTSIKTVTITCRKEGNEPESNEGLGKHFVTFFQLEANGEWIFINKLLARFYFTNRQRVLNLEEISFYRQAKVDPILNYSCDIFSLWAEHKTTWAICVTNLHFFFTSCFDVTFHRVLRNIVKKLSQRCLNSMEHLVRLFCLKYYRAPKYRMRYVIIVLVERRCPGCKNKRSSLLGKQRILTKT